jgi:hypothetical protein
MTNNINIYFGSGFKSINLFVEILNKNKKKFKF